MKSQEYFFSAIKAKISDTLNSTDIDVSVGNEIIFLSHCLAILGESISVSSEILVREANIATAKDKSNLVSQLRGLQQSVDFATPSIGYIQAYYAEYSDLPNTITVNEGDIFNIGSTEFLAVDTITMTPSNVNAELLFYIKVQQISSDYNTVTLAGSTFSNLNTTAFELQGNVVNSTVEVTVNGTPYTYIETGLMTNEDNSFVVTISDEGNALVVLSNNLINTDIVSVRYKVTQGDVTLSYTDSVTHNSRLPTKGLTLSVGSVFSKGYSEPSVDTIRNKLIATYSNSYLTNNLDSIREIHLAETNVEQCLVVNQDGFNFLIFLHDGSDTLVNNAYLTSVQNVIETKYSDNFYNFTYLPLGFTKLAITISVSGTNLGTNVAEQYITALQDNYQNETTIYYSDLYQYIEEIETVDNSVIEDIELIPSIRDNTGISTNVSMVSIDSSNSSQTELVNIHFAVFDTETVNMYEDNTFKKTIKITDDLIEYTSERYGFSFSVMVLNTLSVGELYAFVVYPSLLGKHFIELEDYSVLTIDKEYIDITTNS